MLMMILAAMTAPVFVQHEAQQKAASPPCAIRIFVVSKSVEPEKRAPQRDLIPRDPKSKGPAVLQPGCKTPDKEHADYPMA